MPKLIVHPDTRLLRDLLGNSLVYKVPPFQRSYAWREEQWGELWDDLIALRTKGGPQQHYMGYIVLQALDAPFHFLIVDGQQRLVTLSLLILAAIDLIKDETAGQALEKRFIKDKRHVMDARYTVRLRLNNINNLFYDSYLLERRQPSSMTRVPATNQKMWDAFAYFRSRLQGKFGDSDKDIASFVDEKVADSLVFTVLYVDDEESAFTIFETLNARGVELSSADMLKNYLFSIVYEHWQNDDEMAALEKKWDELSGVLRRESNLTTFLKHYWNSTVEKPIRNKQLYRALRSELKDPREVFALINEIQDAARVYADMQEPENKAWEPDQCKYLTALELCNVRQCYPLLLAAFRRWGRGPEFTKLVRYCLILAFRHVVIGELNPGDLEEPFCKAGHAINSGGAERARDVLCFLEEQYLEDKRFKDAFAGKKFSAKKKNLAKYVLLALEHKQIGADADLTSERNTLEHIFPQNPGDGWDAFTPGEEDLHTWRIGNLALLKGKENREAATKPYAEKQAIYERSAFRLTQECAGHGEWTPRLIGHRQEELAKEACNVWKINFPADA